MGINKHEFKYILYSTIFSVFWFVFLMPYLLNKGVQDSNVYFQFVFFNIGLFILLNLFLKNSTLKTSRGIKTALGLVALFMVMDTFAPPFSVSKSGQLLGSGGDVILIKSSTDYVMGFFASNTLSLSGISVFIFTYIVAPFILLLIAAALLKNFVKEL